MVKGELTHYLDVCLLHEQLTLTYFRRVIIDEQEEDDDDEDERVKKEKKRLTKETGKEEIF